MQIHKVIKPDFVERFKCVGTECLISCCQGWNIFIDKKTHHRYLNADNPEIAALAKENLQPLRKGKNHYSVIKLDGQGQCPFMDGQKLCSVQREMGEQALSPTCAIYPRSTLRYADETRHTMTLSCPEVARLVLFNEDSMKLHEQEKLLANAKINLLGQRQPVSQVSQVIHLFAWNIVQTPTANIEENLMALAHFILYLQRINFELHQRFDEAEAYYHQLLSDLHNGVSLLETPSSLQSSSLKIRALAVLGSLVANDKSRDGNMAQGHQEIADYLNVGELEDGEALNEKFAALDHQWRLLRQNSCLAAPYVLRNYLLYKLYHNHFPGTDLTTVMRQFYRIVLDYFYVKHLLSVKSLQENLDEAVVLKMLASLAEKTLHSSSIDSRMSHAIDKINAGDDLSCLLLIG
ncbi:flagellin lysine-N-methylase [Scandinavium goeteborgense]|uniref:Lysine-N-methylase n=1 Tax=Scandinavium goeteborgense TaxID=1851514 RepID=A0A4R6ECY8_SCAGO|nr:flagellin lysine-N-methylase [Scandinavium goeteborgense]TDN56033.1 lysine-N-methylase [Scandinavium goeteborgense]